VLVALHQSSFNYPEIKVPKPTNPFCTPFPSNNNSVETLKNTKAWLPYETGGAPSSKGLNESVFEF
jgi:hypothetical protein